MAADRYVAQVGLLLRTIPEIAREEIFALKGGTAINLFVRDLPRLSVDIDLVYLPVADRDSSLKAVRDGLSRIAENLQQKLGLGVERHLLPDGKRLIVRSDDSAIKVEVSPVLRGTVFDPVLMTVTPGVEDRFGFAEMQVVSMPDLYAGKIAAALDRQHPCDLFDIFYLFENEGIDDDLYRAFLIYLVSHPRPAHELLCPHLLDISGAYDDEFLGMTVEEVPLGALLAARGRLIEEIQARSREPASREFLSSFHRLEPNWAAIGLGGEIAALPAVRWKLLNLQRLRESNHPKFVEQADHIEACLGGAPGADTQSKAE